MKTSRIVALAILFLAAVGAAGAQVAGRFASVVGRSSTKPPPAPGRPSRSAMPSPRAAWFPWASRARPSSRPPTQRSRSRPSRA
jgi:hypothetical protein